MKTLYSILKLIVLTFLLSSNILAEPPAKSERSKINLYIDAGTFVVVNSVFVNLEVHIASSQSEKMHLYVRGACGSVGTMLGGSGTSSNDGGTSILALTLLTGEANHHFDTSAGICQIDGMALPFIDLGYRFQKPEGGVVFRGKVGILGVGVGFGFAF
jgi:hypothetical protein